MKNKHLWTGIFSAMGLFLLILDGKTAISGAAEGVDLCMHSAIPSLFPFILLSMLMTANLSGFQIPFLRFPGKWLRLPEGAECLLLTGFLGGYPVGANAITEAWRSGHLSKDNAEKMLAFCNNAGPAFLFGIIGPQFSGTAAPWLLWFIHMISALIVSSFLSFQQEAIAASRKTLSLPQTMTQALKAMANICGWIIFFRVGIAFLNRWVLWILPAPWQVAVSGILELTNGCLSLSEIPNEAARFVLCSGLLAFGGISVHMQTLSVTNGLVLNYYFPGKILQTALSILFSAWIIHFDIKIALLAAMIAILSAIYLRKMENRGGIPAVVGV